MNKTDKKILEYLERAKVLTISARFYSNESVGISNNWHKVVEIAKMIQLEEMNKPIITGVEMSKTKTGNLKIKCPNCKFEYIFYKGRKAREERICGNCGTKIILEKLETIKEAK